MSAVQLKKLWTLIGAVLVFYSLNAWLVGQGVNSVFNATLLDARPRFVSLFAIPICSVLLVLLCHIGIAYARATPTGSWHARIPVVWLDAVDTKTRAGMIYQGFFVVMFLLVPCAALIHFLQKVASVNLVKDGEILPETRFFDWVPWREVSTHAYELANGIGTPPAKVAFWPDGEPILFVGLAILAIAHVAWLGIALLKGPVPSNFNHS